MDLKDELVLASHNPGKLAEFKSLLTPYGVTIISAAKLGLDEPEETGSTFVENAILKARFVANETGKISLADDSGFIINALNNFPGVQSARYSKSFPDLKACYADLNQKIGDKDKTAYFECALCLYHPDGRHEEFVGEIEGQFVFPPRGDDGFCFDFVFQPQEYDKTFAELGRTIKNKISHRAQAISKFINTCLKTQ